MGYQNFISTMMDYLNYFDESDLDYSDYDYSDYDYSDYDYSDYDDSDYDYSDTDYDEDDYMRSYAYSSSYRRSGNEPGHWKSKAMYNRDGKKYTWSKEGDGKMISFKWPSNWPKWADSDYYYGTDYDSEYDDSDYYDSDYYY